MWPVCPRRWAAVAMSHDRLWRVLWHEGGREGGLRCTDSLNAAKVSVQGAGNVGAALVGHLVKEGAQVFLTDIHEDRLAASPRFIRSPSWGRTRCDLDVDTIPLRPGPPR